MTKRDKEFAPMGDKCVSITDLKYGKFMVYTKNHNRISCHSAILVSSKVRTILLDYLIHNRWNAVEYQKLDGDDKTDMDKIMSITGMEYDLGGLADTSSEDIKRFNLLKGELLAGNDSREVIREMQKLVLRLASHKRIPKSAAYSIMYELVSLLP
jgi:hypothetical protein